jgi:acetyl-CoA synthetase
MIKKEGLYYPSEDFKSKAHAKNEEIYEEARKDILSFWEKNANEVVWQEKWKEIFSHKPPYFNWFSGGKINITESVLDKNKESEKIAIIFCPNSPDEEELKITYKDLYKKVNQFANALKKMGVKKGDPVGIYMPMIPETVISLLACARIGAMHTVVFSAFSPSALRVRLQDTEAKVLITADGFKRAHEIVSLKKNVDEGIKETSIEKVILVKRGGQEIDFTEKDVWWHDIVENESDECVAEKMESEDPLFILYTSGSTGKPKGVLHTCGGYAVQAKITGKLIFDIKEEDVFWSTADIGWITGHTYTVYSPLLNGATTVIFEGVPNWPNADRFADIIEKHNVTIFYTAPTAIRMFKMQLGVVTKEMNSLRLLGSVGEPIDEDTWEWYYKEVGKERCPIVDTWWQTETGGILITSLPGVGPFKPTFTGRTFPGVNFDIYNPEGGEVKEGEAGDLVILPPFSPGMLRGVYKNDEKYRKTYFTDYGEEVYYTSDKAYRDENGLIRIVGRADDVIKVAGHRLSTGEMENIVAKNKDVAECAVVGIKDEIRGEVPVVFAVVTSQRDGITEEIKKALWDEIGPIAMVKSIYLVDDLPKTRSGKIMRRIMKKLFTGEELGDLSTLANPESVDGLKKIINTNL